MKNYFGYLLWFAAIFALSLTSCRKGNPIVPSESVIVNPNEKMTGGIYGFFLLNEGNMGSNKASLDHYNYQTGGYTRNIYGERNPQEVKDLGDVGNDIQIYGDQLWATINCSNFVEVMDVRTGRHITKIVIPNCRYLAFKDGYAYVTSYAGPVQLGDRSRIGYVAKIDTATFEIVGECIVGYQPEEMAIVGDKMYVANSGGYTPPDYDRTVSVIDLVEFKEMYKIDVAINLHRLQLDNYGNLYVTSRGDHYNIPSKTFIIDTRTDKVTDALEDLPCSNMALYGDSLYMYSYGWSYNSKDKDIRYMIFNTRNKEIVTSNFIKDGTDQKIKVPYGIAVHPATGEFFVTDAGNYVTPGVLHCFDPEGMHKWSVTTGDIPAHIVFARKPLVPLGELNLR